MFTRTIAFFKNIHKEISIRSSLILFYLGLISFVSVLIILVNQQILNRVLIDLTKRIMQQAGDLVQEQIEDYLTPLTYNLNNSVNLFAQGIVQPGSSALFKQYLIGLTWDLPQVYSAYWASPRGDFFGITRHEKNVFQIWHINRSSKPAEFFYGLTTYEGQLPALKKTGYQSYDPRTRPWYQQATVKDLAWTGVYKFALFTEQGVFPYGITAARALYDKKHHLLGVFGVDLTLGELENFIQKIQVTPNSVILVTNQEGSLIAAHGIVNFEQAVGKQITPTFLQAAGMPAQFQYLFHLPQANSKTYRYTQADDYLIIQKILKLSAHNAWWVTIIVPAKDILGPLKLAGLISLLSALLVLITGILIANIISNRITQPIKEIAEGAKAIEKFELEKIVTISSNIKEINTLSKAFETMKKGLQSFERYVPTVLIKKLFASGKIARVGGETKVLTFLFSDIQDFTALIEHAKPQSVMQFLYEYLDGMTKIVHQYHGTIDKYVGDMIIAFWGAPESDEKQAQHACECALQMLRFLRRLNKKWRHDFGYVNIRLAINTGPALVGNVGSSERLSYTALGDSVNLTSRLEEANKLYKTNIIITENTLKQLDKSMRYRFIDNIVVRGKQQSVKIFELNPPQFKRQELKNYNQIFAKAFAAYQQAQWLVAENLFTLLAEQFPWDNVAKIFVARCKLLLQVNPAEWDGVWRLE